MGYNVSFCNFKPAAWFSRLTAELIVEHVFKSELNALPCGYSGNAKGVADAYFLPHAKEDLTRANDEANEELVLSSREIWVYRDVVYAIYPDTNVDGNGEWDMFAANEAFVKITWLWFILGCVGVAVVVVGSKWGLDSSNSVTMLCNFRKPLGRKVRSIFHGQRCQTTGRWS